MTLRVVLWDLCRGGMRKLPLLDRLVAADVLLLLAVSPTLAHRYRQHWEERYDCAVALELTTSGHKRPHGAMIASRWPIVDAWIIDELPLPERSLVARIEHPLGRLTAVSWGTPNAAGDTRPVKEAAYRHMTAYLPTLAYPMVVGIDTNSWYDPPRRAELDPDSRQPAEHGFLHRDPLTDSSTFTARWLTPIRTVRGCWRTCAPMGRWQPPLFAVPTVNLAASLPASRLAKPSGSTGWTGSSSPMS
jgi:hypothetical protein